MGSPPKVGLVPEAALPNRDHDSANQSGMIPGSVTDVTVIARSDSDEAIHSVHAARWIASLRSQ
jgi:hypothetical protein